MSLRPQRGCGSPPGQVAWLVTRLAGYLDLDFSLVTQILVRAQGFQKLPVGTGRRPGTGFHSDDRPGHVLAGQEVVGAASR